MRQFFHTLELFFDSLSRLRAVATAGAARRWNLFGTTLHVTVAAGLLAVPALAEHGLTGREYQHLGAALDAMNLTEADLGFAKDVGEPRLCLGWIRAALQDPYALTRAARELQDTAAAGEAAPWWVTAGALLELGKTPEAEAAAASEADTWEGLDPKLAESLSRFMQSARQANRLLDRAYATLSREDMSRLAASTLAGSFNAEDDEWTRAALADAGVAEGDVKAAIDEGHELDATPSATRYLDLVEKIDRTALIEACHVFHRAVMDLAAAARGVEKWPDGNVLLVTDLGKVRVSSVGDDTFSDRALLILAPGGHNTYLAAAGAANALRDQRLSAIIDLGGNDTYRSTGLIGAGAALFGVSVVVDAAGDDTWRAAYMGQGAGVFGAGWVEEGGGEDDYEARALAQGAAVAGVGALMDRGGHDVYDVGLQGQAFAGLHGMALLVDDAGNDRYLAGGREPDHERNQDRYLSLAQGFSIGLRPFAGGGVAALIDRAGNDTYVADVYGQGVGYYYSAGLLLDGGGNDTYSAYQYAQGAGIHLSLGLLVDEGGHDTYSGGILVQGVAHDFAVGGLIDRGGRDTYLADHDAQGHGMNNALGWLLDSGGDDVYVARDPSNSQGVGNSGGERESGSLGLLLDLGGRDRYTCGATDHLRLQRPLYGVVYDVGEETADGR